MDSYVTVNGKKFRRGYTTGSCAAAAAKAAVIMLFSGKRIDNVELDTPAGISLNLAVSDIELKHDSVRCCVVKDGGDDPDITTGLKIFSEVKASDKAGIRVAAAEGIGRVTLPGLKVCVGQPAINPVPMKMILKEVGEALPDGKGVEIVISVPGGEEVAKKTYNPKLGILGGISILGTTGIVEPMSEEAWKESLALELGVMAAKGLDEAVFIFGNYGEEFAVGKLNIDKSKIIKVSNFVGFMLDEAVKLKFKRIIIIGHMGKIIKLSAGIFHTHSRIADARMEILSAYAALEGATRHQVEAIYGCRTTDAADELISRYKLNSVYNRVVSNVSKRCNEYTYGRIEFGAVLFNGTDKLLAMDENASRVIKKLDP